MLTRLPLQLRAPILLASVGLLGSLASCAPPGPGDPGEVEELESVGQIESALTASQRRSRATHIRDAAAAAGLTNGLLLAGIAQAETGLAHCWSEATWACQGPASSSCGGGPVIAGAGDGPCSIRQGGLGLFQFDAGTYDQTLAREGNRILTVEGNTQAAVDFVVNMVIRSQFISGVDNRSQALAWMNAVRVGGPTYSTWIRTVTSYYNGCFEGRCSVYSSRYRHYDDSTRHMLNELGNDFWYGPQVPLHPRISLGRAIETVPGQERDMLAEGPSAGIFDLRMGQQTRVMFDVTNAADATRAASGGRVQIEVNEALEVTHWTILDNWPSNACGGDWCPNSADSAAGQPPHDNPGQSFALDTHAVSPGETKRVVLTLTARSPTPAGAGTGEGHAAVRIFVARIDGFYEKASFGGAPTLNEGDFQTFNGGDLRTSVQIDVLPGPQDSMAPDPADSTDPADPTEDPAAPTDPGDDASQPVNGDDPAAPADPFDPTDPTDPGPRSPPAATPPGGTGATPGSLPGGEPGTALPPGRGGDVVGGCSVSPGAAPGSSAIPALLAFLALAAGAWRRPRRR